MNSFFHCIAAVDQHCILKEKIPGNNDENSMIDERLLNTFVACLSTQYIASLMLLNITIEHL